MKNINSQVLRKTFAFSLVRFILVRLVLARFVLAAILIPALLIGSAFTFGGSKLQAQANGSPNGQSSKQGFFAGIVYLNGFKVDSSTKTTSVTNANISIVGDATTSYTLIGYSAITTGIEAKAASFFDSSPLKAGLEALIAKNCETGAATADAGGTYSFLNPYIQTFDEGSRDFVGDSATSITNNWPLNTCLEHFSSNGLTDASFDDYEVTADDIIVHGSISTTSTTPTDTSTTSKSDKLSGIGLQFGFRWEKWRASLTHFTGKGGANKLSNTLVMADYFFNEDFFVGGGLASMKLTNSANGSTSESAISPAIQIGYKKKLTSNLSLNFGLTKYISGVSLKSSTAPTTTPYTPDPIFNPANTTRNTLTHEQGPIKGGSVVMGTVNVNTNGNSFNSVVVSGVGDLRTEATQFGSRTVTVEETIETGTTTTTEGTIETTTETAAELKAPLVISISFHLTF